jgi:uncharacterized membrane-anchored protein
MPQYSSGSPRFALAGTALFAALLIALVIAQIWACAFNPWLYLATIVASTTFGTTMADFADRSLGIGYTGGANLLFVVYSSFSAFGNWSKGTVSVETISRRGSRRSIGRPSPSRRRAEPRWVIGQSTQVA